MILNQVLTGAANVSDAGVAVAVGSVDGYTFTAYGSGFDIIVLGDNFHRVQILRGAVQDATAIVRCIDSSSIDGKIAVSYGSTVLIYKPKPVSDESSDLRLPYVWQEVAQIKVNSEVRQLCWDFEAKRLLVGCNDILLFRYVLPDSEKKGLWTCVWTRSLPNPVDMAKFSPDGVYFATTSKDEGLVKIWYSTQKTLERLFGSRVSQQTSLELLSEESHNFIYITHAKPVISFSWRGVSSYMPQGSVANCLLTCGCDNVTRLWVETVKVRSHRPFHQSQQCPVREGGLAKGGCLAGSDGHQLIPLIHFHLAAVIDPVTDLPAVASPNISQVRSAKFKLFWMNNKEIQFSVAAEALLGSHAHTLKEQCSPGDNAPAGFDQDEYAILEEPDSAVPPFDPLQETNPQDASADLESPSENSLDVVSLDSVASKQTSPWETQSRLSAMMRQWYRGKDVLICIHPINGGIITWVVDYLDEYWEMPYHQPQVTFALWIPNAFSREDALSLCTLVVNHNARVLGQVSHSVAVMSTAVNPSVESANTRLLIQQSSILISAHSDGSLNQWQLSFADNFSFSSVASITHLVRNCGPRFETSLILPHPHLPIMLTASHNQSSMSRKVSEGSLSFISPDEELGDCVSELILWRSRNVGPLTRAGGIIEMSRISSMEKDAFRSVAWFPNLYRHSLLTVAAPTTATLTNFPCACFAVTTKSCLTVYQVILDAKGFFASLSQSQQRPGSVSTAGTLTGLVASEQSGSLTGCVMKVCELPDSDSIVEPLFLHVYSEKSLLGTASTEKSMLESDRVYIVAAALETIEAGNTQYLCVHMWLASLVSVNSAYNKGFEQEDLGSERIFYVKNSPPSTPSPLSVTSLLKVRKVCLQELPLPMGQTVVQFQPLADIVSQSCCNPYNQLPSVFSTLCQDGKLRFWSCQEISPTGGTTEDCSGELNFVGSSDDGLDYGQSSRYVFFEVKQQAAGLGDQVAPNGIDRLLALSFVHPYRFATIELPRPSSQAAGNQLHMQSFLVGIYEMESLGGMRWSKEASMLLPFADAHYQPSSRASRPVANVVWMPLENGLYLLTVFVNGYVSVFGPNQAQNLNQQKASWTLMHNIDLGKDASITSMAWAWGGVLIVGVENEMMVFSPWEKVSTGLTEESLPSWMIKGSLDGAGVKNIFLRALDHCPVLPQYHPSYLKESMNRGKIRRVRAILAYLVMCLSKQTNHVDATDLEHSRDSGQVTPRDGNVLSPGRTRHSSLSYEPKESHYVFSPAKTAWRHPVAIPPLPVYVLQAIDKDPSAMVNFMPSSEDSESDQEPGVDSLISLFDRPSCLLERSLSFTNEAPAERQVIGFGVSQAQALSQLIAANQLPGLNEMDQVHLLALAETIASTTLDLASDMGTLTSNKQTQGRVSKADEVLDDCGIRFLFAVHLHSALVKSLPLPQRHILASKGMDPSQFAWAYHSEYPDQLLAAIPCISRAEPVWSELREYGVGWWYRNLQGLRLLFEKIAKTQYQLSQNPLDCALYYLALKKKSVVAALYKSLRDTKMTQFFSNDFSQDRWKKAAMKNAFALLGTQRFEHAAAFFLLAGSLHDATQVCLDRLGDVQLALCISRLFESNHIVFDQILRDHVLGLGPRSDPFLQSIAFWMLKDYTSACYVLLLNSTGEEPGNSSEPGGEICSLNLSDISSFFTYLKSHPLVWRHSNTVLRYGSSELQLTCCGCIHSVGTLRQTERQLYFKSAHGLLNQGLPSLALDALMQLGSLSVEVVSASILGTDQQQQQPWKQSADDTVNSAALWDASHVGAQSHDHCVGFVPVNSSATCEAPQNADSFDWSQPVSSTLPSSSIDRADSSVFSTQDTPKLPSRKVSFSLDSHSSFTTQTGTPRYLRQRSQSELQENLDMLSDAEGAVFVSEADMNRLSADVDTDHLASITGYHLRFMCLLKCLIEEIKSLPLLCATEHRQLRRTLNHLFEKELQVLHELCSFSVIEPYNPDVGIADSRKSADNNCAIQQKLLKSQQHQLWLKKNRQVFTGMLKHCSLQGGELAAMSLELMLLLHELENSTVLANPLTSSISINPSSPPLLLASMSLFALVASPIAFLQSMTQDIVHTITQLPCLPITGEIPPMLTALQNVSVTLSLCVYHSLCGGEEMSVMRSLKLGHITLIGVENSEGKFVELMDQVESSGVPNLSATSPPSQWPGVRQLRSLLVANGKDSSLQLRTVLCEVAAACYLCLLLRAATLKDSGHLCRLVVNTLSDDLWAQAFGGGTRVVFTTSPSSLVQRAQLESPLQNVDESKRRLYYRLIGSKASVSSTDEKQSIEETFIPPSMPLHEYFLQKPKSNYLKGFEYDSDDDDDSGELTDEEEEEDGEDPTSAHGLTKRIENYAWQLMFLAVLRLSSENLKAFVSSIGLSVADLATQSPLLHAILNLLLKWQQVILTWLDGCGGAPEGFLPYQPSGGTPRCGSMLARLKILLDPKTAPFRSTSPRVTPYKRLWYTLCYQKLVQHLMVMYSFSNVVTQSPSNDSPSETDHFILFQDDEVVSSFCFNTANHKVIALTTAHEVLELNEMALLSYLDYSGEDDFDDFSFKDPDSAVHKQISRQFDDASSQNTLDPSGNAVPPRKTLVKVKNLKRALPGVRKLESHPTLPYYLTGGSDGSVRLWYFGQMDELCTYKPANSGDKINRIHFSCLGNKVSMADDSGVVTLWNFQHGAIPQPLFTNKCHSKHTKDVAFLGSSSLFATAGYSSDARNICLWDILMPPRSCLVHASVCHEHGAQVALYLPSYQMLLTGGRKGSICLFDVRQRRIFSSFPAHDSTVRCVSVDPGTDTFATGSLDGDIKVWNMFNSQPVAFYPREHVRPGYLRTSTAGVNHLALTSGRLYSCGGDGTLKLRSLSVQR